MKTVLIFDSVLEEPIKFLVVDGDYSYLNQKYLNSMDTTDEESDIINALVFTEDWHYVDSFLEDFPVEVVQQGAKVVVVGFLP